MEILMLVLLYYLSQNADFADSVKPLMSKIKDSEEMLRFLNDLSKFTQTFSAFGGKAETNDKSQREPNKDCVNKRESTNEQPNEQKENPQSPTAGIADEFIQNILDSYLKKH
ncbi:MAG: hypothetical protein IJY63_05905 [Clostridia bacterium]|nr:hypothetical protein [Clostridia bacterium]